MERKEKRKNEGEKERKKGRRKTANEKRERKGKEKRRFTRVRIKVARFSP